ncbi:virulence factor SrfC family protein [Acerihabitans sp. TG2]|uniref:putative virulence factor n=1 Tax=Acerihabitans sp. TG2 TaxID=3096008 RepID=UPI002B22209A|nr:virulence factor SrfC family protein [Acerihabitans sp. TG2]MEA9391536.1 virulence factor SrfC family protein [Acerihabitans sp. TG2]
MNRLTPEQLTTRWQAVYQGAGQAIDWIQDARPQAPRLNAEADNLVFKLRRSRNKAQNLANAVCKPVTVGFFGLSQAGKSYLISALAAGDNGRLETCLGGRQLDFLDHINPAGNGKESTGLVTRFSRQAVSDNPDYPVKLQLFSEVEIGKILANAFLYDFNQQKFAGAELTESRIDAHLQRLTARRQATPVSGLGNDDVVSLWDYLTYHAENSQKPLAVRFWPAAVELAPYLTIDDRAQLFSLLWGDIAELTETYGRFAHTLQRLGGAEGVLAPLGTLVSEQDGVFIQSDSIMNVSMLERLNTPDDKRIQVCPVTAGRTGAPVELSLAELAALTVELVIPLLASTQKTLFEQVDILDFPGYRSRLNMDSMDGGGGEVNSDTSKPLAKLILRSKVSYLFERYTDHQEMNVLVLCAASSKQSDVIEVGGALEKWITHTQGETAEIRARRPSGLLWALTMFDQRITNSLGYNDTMLRESWGEKGLIQMAMIEHFGRYPWFQQWQPGQPFNTTFLVRKPRHSTSFIRIEQQGEVALEANSAEKIALMRSMFTEDSLVKRHVDRPGEAWDAMLTLDDGGMRRLADYLSTVARPEVKLDRITEQLHEVQRELVDNRLSTWFQPDGAQDYLKKQRIAEDILKVLQQRTGVHGELLDRLLPDRDALRNLYLQEPVSSQETADSDSAPTEDSIPAANTFGIVGDIDLFGDTPCAQPQANETTMPVGNGYEVEFARVVLRYWINHLRNLPENLPFIELINIEKSMVATLADELITASMRLDVESALIRTLAGTEQVGVRRGSRVERQVARVLTVLGDFISWLGYLAITEPNRPDSRYHRGHKIFAVPDRINVGWGDADRLMKLTSVPINYTALYIYDWLVGLGEMIKNNAGHSAGREISAEQNERLGVILNLIKPSLPE